MFFHYLYQHNFIITRQFFPEWKTLRITLFSFQWLFFFPRMNIKVFSSTKEIIRQLFPFEESLQSSYKIVMLLCSTPTPPVLNHYIMILIQSTLNQTLKPHNYIKFTLPLSEMLLKSAVFPLLNKNKLSIFLSND